MLPISRDDAAYFVDVFLMHHVIGLAVAADEEAADIPAVTSPEVAGPACCNLAGSAINTAVYCSRRFMKANLDDLVRRCAGPTRRFKRSGAEVAGKCPPQDSWRAGTGWVPCSWAGGASQRRRPRTRRAS